MSQPRHPIIRAISIPAMFAGTVVGLGDFIFAVLSIGPDFNATRGVALGILGMVAMGVYILASQPASKA